MIVLHSAQAEFPSTTQNHGVELLCTLHCIPLKSIFVVFMMPLQVAKNFLWATAKSSPFQPTYFSCMIFLVRLSLFTISLQACYARRPKLVTPRLGIPRPPSLFDLWILSQHKVCNPCSPCFSLKKIKLRNFINFTD